MKSYRSVDQFVDQLEFWKPEVIRLREIIGKTPLEETVKWSFPCYAFQGKNVVGLGVAKSYFGLWFFQGALIDDSDQVLINAQEGKTKAMRQWRMSDRKQIKVRQIRKYLDLAMEVVKSGAEIKPDRKQPLMVDPLLKSALKKNSKAAAIFEAMRPGCQREYANYINEAKREETKLRRIAKILPMIVAGGGLNDQYRS